MNGINKISQLIRTFPYRISIIAFNPIPIRILILRWFLKKLSFVPYELRLKYDAVERPCYGYCIFNSLRMAIALGYKKVSIIEFGVAGGNGLVNIGKHVREIQKKFNIKVDIYGFDLAKGLPKPKDYRDLPYQWKQGFYKMDIPALKKRLKNAQLVLGDVRKTVKKFKGAPIACVMFDLDYYCSTKEALKIFEKPHLPRVYCYFDDVDGNEYSLYSQYTGELLAINQFNKKNNNKIDNLRINTSYSNKVFILHDFKHAKYNTFINYENGLDCILNKEI